MKSLLTTIVTAFALLATTIAVPNPLPNGTLSQTQPSTTAEMLEIETLTWEYIRFEVTLIYWETLYTTQDVVGTTVLPTPYSSDFIDNVDFITDAIFETQTDVSGLSWMARWRIAVQMSNELNAELIEDAFRKEDFNNKQAQ